jgi:hypothetical protein
LLEKAEALFGSAASGSVIILLLLGNKLIYLLEAELEWISFSAQVGKGLI